MENKRKTRAAKLAVKDVSPSAKTVTAIVTAPTLDRDYEIVDTESLRLPLKGGGFKYARELDGTEDLSIPFQVDHSRSVYDTIGSVKSAIINQAGELEVTFSLSSRKGAQELLTLLQEGHLDNAFSISYLYEWDKIIDNTIFDAEITEISLVWRGANYDARLLAVSKSLNQKGQTMDKSVELAKKQAELKTAVEKAEALAAEVKTLETAEAEPEQPEATDEGEGEAEPKKPAENNEDNEEVEETETESETPEETETTTNTPEGTETPNEGEKGKKTMDKNKQVATKSAATKVNTEVPKAGEGAEGATVNYKEQAIKYLQARLAGHRDEAAELAQEYVKKIGSDVKEKITSSKVFMGLKADNRYNYPDYDAILLPAQIAQDIIEAEEAFGGVAATVDEITINGPIYDLLVEDPTDQLVPNGFGTDQGDGVKRPNKAVKKFNWVKRTLRPKTWALVRYWDKELAADSAIQLYDRIVAKFAKANSKTKDYIILKFAGTTSGATTFEATGIRADAGVPTAEYTIPTFSDDLNDALSGIVGDGDVVAYMNRKTAYQIRKIKDANGRSLYKGTGSEVLDLGEFGIKQVVLTSVMGTGEITVGIGKLYKLVNRGALEILTSQEATIVDGDDVISLFQTNGFGVLGEARYDGGVSVDEAFVNLSLEGTS